MFVLFSLQIVCQVGNCCKKSLKIPKGYRNQNLYIEEGHPTQWPKEKRQKGQTMIYKTLHIKLEID